MTLAPSAGLIWSLAELEASMAGFEEILPGHFWIGACKAADIDLPTFFQKLPARVMGDAEGITADIGGIADALGEAGVDAKRFRRAYRTVLGKRAGAPRKGHISRSRAARSDFSRAARLAQSGDGVLRPAHLLYVMLGRDDAQRDDVLAGCGGDGAKLASALEAIFAGGGEIQGPGDEEGNEPAKHDAVRGKFQGEGKPRKSALERFGRDLTKLARDGKLPVLIGRKEEMLRLAQILAQERKSNAVLVGEPGTGKTGIVEGFAQRVAEGKVPDGLQGARVVELSMPLLVAGTRYRGDFEARMEAVLKEAASEPTLILFLDEIHTLVGAGAADGAMNAANILKPALARGEIRVIGATTTAEYRRFIEKDAALERRFQVVWIEEPSRDEAVEILRGVRGRLEEHHGVKIADEALVAAVDLSLRHIPDFRLPDKALDLVDQAAAQARFSTFSPKEVAGEGLVIAREHIAAAVARRCRIPVAELTVEENERLRDMEARLGERVKGQDAAIAAVCDAIRVARAGLKPPNRPAGVFLFVGPTGTGKTELAKALAELLFHDERSLVRFDMSEFMEEHSVSKLIGAPPGYKGHDEGGQLTERVRSRPYSVVLLDEIEKAHPRVLDIFLQVFDEGHLTDGRGRRADFRECVIVMTSNLGAGSDKPKRALGFGREDIASKPEAGEGRIGVAIKAHFRPEFINRLSGIVTFQPLGQDDLRQIVGKIIGQLNQRMADRGLTISLSPEVEDFLIERGCSPEYGARELERTIERFVVQPLAAQLLDRPLPVGAKLRVNVDGDRLRFTSGD